MGGNNNKNPLKPATPAVPFAPQPQVPTQTFQGFMPQEQQGLLASQLAAGGFGTPQGNMGILTNLYKNVTMPVISNPGQIAQYLPQMGQTPVTGGSPPSVAPIVPGATPRPPAGTTPVPTNGQVFDPRRPNHRTRDDNFGR